MKLDELITPSDLREVMEFERSLVHQDREKARELIYKWGAEIDDDFVDLCATHSPSRNVATGMFRMLVYIDQALKRKKVQ
jgi:hypothetical protein